MAGDYYGGATFCQSCGERLPAGASFCSRCGASAPGGASGSSCPRCGAALQSDWLYCNMCGEVLNRSDIRITPNPTSASGPSYTPTPEPSYSTPTPAPTPATTSSRTGGLDYNFRDASGRGAEETTVLGSSGEESKLSGTMFKQAGDL